MQMKNVIGITFGDAAGIGAEIVCKTAATGFLQEHSIPVIVGQEDMLLRGMRHTGVSLSLPCDKQCRAGKGARPDCAVARRQFGCRQRKDGHGI